MDSRATAFRSWLFTSAGYSDVTLLKMTESAAIAVIAAYLDVIARSGVNPQTGDPVQAKTLNLHLQAAAAYLRSTTHLQINISTKGSSMHPCLNKLFANTFLHPTLLPGLRFPLSGLRGNLHVAPCHRPSHQTQPTFGRISVQFVRQFHFPPLLGHHHGSAPSRCHGLP